MLIGSKKAHVERGGLDSFRSTSSLQLAPSYLSSATSACDEISWVVYPGLFAGGKLDVMTSFLLAHIEPISSLYEAPGQAAAAPIRVLDFACGSGVIAAALALRARHGSTGAPRKGMRQGGRPRSVVIDALDADTVAVNAASLNLGVGSSVPGDSFDGAVQVSLNVVLSDGFTALTQEQKYDWIVSNPPLHRGKALDFTVQKTFYYFFIVFLHN